VSIAVIAHNAMGTLGPCMRGVRDSGCPHDRVTVYDVASTDGTGRWLQEHYPGVRVVRMAVNDGPNPSRNLGVRDSPTPYVVLIDADVQLLPDTVQTLRETIEAHPSAAVATPVVLYSDRPTTVQYRRTWVHFLAEASAEVHDIPLHRLDGQTRRVGLASGCAPLIRRDAAEAVGMFEERYFFGKTDGEFAYRITTGGFDIVEPAAAQVLHHHNKRGSKFFQHQMRNRWHFMAKNFQRRTLIAGLPAQLIHEPLLLLTMLVMGKGGDYLRALVSFCKLLPTLREDRREVARMRRRHDWQVLRGDQLVIPASVGHRPGFKQLAGLYREWLRLYWAVMQALLKRVSRPFEDGGVDVMRPELPIAHDRDGGP